MFSPATEERVGSVPVAGPKDIDAAIAAARTAFDDGPWPRTSPAERAQVTRLLLSQGLEHLAPAAAAGGR